MTKSPPAHELPKAARARPRRIWLLLGSLALAAIICALWLIVRPVELSQESAEHTAKNAQTLWSNGHLGPAEEMLAYLSRTKHRVTLGERLLRAQIAKERGRLDDAVAALDGVADSDPDAATLSQARGLLEFARDRAAPAEVALLAAVARNPNLKEARRGLVDLYAIEGRKSDLVAQFRALAGTSVLTFDDLYLWCLGRRQDLGPAEFAAKLEPMLGNDPSNRTLRLALAENQRRLGQLDEAEQSLAPLSEDDPDALAAKPPGWQSTAARWKPPIVFWRRAPPVTRHWRGCAAGWLSAVAMSPRWVIFGRRLRKSRTTATPSSAWASRSVPPAEPRRPGLSSKRLAPATILIG